MCEGTTYKYNYTILAPDLECAQCNTQRLIIFNLKEFSTPVGTAIGKDKIF